MLHFHFKTFRLSGCAKVYSTELLIKHSNFNSVTQRVYKSHILINFHEWCILYLSYSCESSYKNKNRISCFFCNQAIGSYSLDCLHDKSLQLCLTLCNSVNCSLPGSSVHWISQARILDWVAISFSSRSSRPREWTWVSRIIGRHFTVWATKEVHIHYGG